MLVDEVTISIKAGNGGNGRVSFAHSKENRKGGPDGGNGGNGGSIFVVGVDDIAALAQFRYKKDIKGEDGVPGKKNNLFGKNGKDTTILVPIGTTITDTATKEAWHVENAQSPILLAKGGVGGKGNNEFKSATNQTPRFAEKGKPGQEKKLFLELKLFADVGLIGLPNAGKSSLLAALTHAHPKIANYPFTTLEPNLGVLSLTSGVSSKSTPDVSHVILADIPGLIEGASSGKGLGVKFLKHIEKTKLLVHCIDSSEDVSIVYQTVRRELSSFGKNLESKPEIILVTKKDLTDNETVEKKVKALQKLTKKTVLTISVYDLESLESFKKLLIQESN